MCKLAKMTSFHVPDMSCMHCVRAIKAALQPMHGVTAVDVDLAAKVVTVTHDPALVDEDKLKAALAGAGYPVAG